MDDDHTGLTMLLLALGSVAAGILAIVVRARMSKGHGRPMGAAPAAAAFVEGLAGFFVVAIFPWMIFVPAAFFAAWAVGILRRRGTEATLRAELLIVLALLWVGLDSCPATVSLTCLELPCRGSLRLATMFALLFPLAVFFTENQYSFRMYFELASIFMTFGVVTGLLGVILVDTWGRAAADGCLSYYYRGTAEASFE